MHKTTKLKKYLELFRRNIKSYLAPGISIKAVVYPVQAEGAVFEFILNKEEDNSDAFEKARPTVGKILSEIPQRLVGGNIESIKFGGTNLYLEGNRILLIKGEDDISSWSGSAIAEDVERVVSTSMGGKTT